MVDEKVLYEGKPSYKLFWSFSISWILIFILVFLIFVLNPLIIAFSTGLTNTAWTILICYILICAIILVYLLFLVKTYKYKITDKGIYFSGGILTKREKFVPFFKVTNVDVLQTFIDQLLGISKLGFQTAGQGAANMPEITFRGLENPTIPKEIASKWLTK